MVSPTASSLLDRRRIFWFWLPLAAMWLMMAIEQPIVAAVTARLPDPEINLAAFGITFALALFVEGPVVMLLTAATALPKDRQSYRRLLHFTHIMAGLFTGLHLLIAGTPLYNLIVEGLIGAPSEVIEMSRHGFLILTPWSAAIAYRRLWQGVLIRFNRTKVVPLTIGARLLCTTTVLVLGLYLGRYTGVYVGATALSIGVVAAAIVAYLFARPTISTYLSSDSFDGEELSWSALLTFYLPLALTSLIVLANQPIFTTALARAPRPLLSLAVWPVLMSLLFLGRSIALSYQEATVALLSDRRSYEQLQNFARMVAAALTGLFFLLAITPLSTFWYARVSGLSSELVSTAILPTLLIALVPGISLLISWQRGVLVHAKETHHISRSVMLSLLILVLGLAGGITFLPLPGAVTAAGALTISILAEWGYLTYRARLAARKMALIPEKVEAVPVVS